MKGSMYFEREIAEDVLLICGSHPAGIDVTSAVVSSRGQAAVVDSLWQPEEVMRLLKGLGGRGLTPVALLITHWHLDHTGGNEHFHVPIISQDRCLDLMKSDLPAQVKSAKEELGLALNVRYPTRTFERTLSLEVGGRELTLLHLPGHTPDSMGVYLKGERLLFAGDDVMELPYVGYGDSLELLNSLKRIAGMDVTTIVQGHGPPCGRAKVLEDIKYLEACRKEIRGAIDRSWPQDSTVQLPLEQFLPAQRLEHLPKLWREIHEENLQKIREELTGPKGTR